MATAPHQTFRVIISQKGGQKHHSEATRTGIGSSCTACYLGTAHTPTRVQENSKRRTVPPVRLWPGGTANPHFRDTAKPGDVAVIPGLVG